MSGESGAPVQARRSVRRICWYITKATARRCDCGGLTPPVLCGTAPSSSIPRGSYELDRRTQVVVFDNTRLCVDRFPVGLRDHRWHSITRSQSSQVAQLEPSKVIGIDDWFALHIKPDAYVQHSRGSIRAYCSKVSRASSIDRNGYSIESRIRIGLTSDWQRADTA
jgi:hypothetical protein